MFKERRVPVFVVTGFLESGKTTFIRNALISDPKLEKEKVLLICSEEGEMEYGELPKNIRMENLEDPEELTGDLLEKLDREFRPTFVIFELNCMWGMKTLYQQKRPKAWQLVDHITVIDSTTFESYFSNMKNIFVDMISASMTVLMNRCTREDDFKFYKDTIRRISPRAEILYISDEEGRLDITLEEDLPYSLNDPVISLDDETYVIWYIDMMDNPERYIGKVVEYVGQVMKPPYYREEVCTVGNMVMTCCEDDMQFFGYLCKLGSATGVAEGDYIRIRGEVRWEYAPEYAEEGAVLYAKKVVPVSGPKKKKR